jgi:protein O-GlcNAc transferase
MKIISFSLWGHHERYFLGAFKNCELAMKWYPDWECFFYVRSDSNSEYVSKLKTYKNSNVIEVESLDDKRGLFWRFIPAFDKSIDVTIVRDCDSRLSQRESLAVSEWLQSDKSFHIMRDHPYHNTEILGGMWGVKNRSIDLGDPLTLDIISQYRDEYQEDQRYLREKIWPLVKDDCIIHDEFFGGIKFPKARYNYDDFVGQQYNELDLPVKENSDILKKYIESR